jgi:hypothetical protein
MTWVLGEAFGHRGGSGGCYDVSVDGGPSSMADSGTKR